MFRILFAREASSQLEKLDNDMKKRVKTALENISNNRFRSSQIKKLKGVTKEYRYRVGNYRIIVITPKN